MKYRIHFNVKPKLFDNLIGAFDDIITEFDFLNKKDLVDIYF